MKLKYKANLPNRFLGLEKAGIVPKGKVFERGDIIEAEGTIIYNLKASGFVEVQDEPTTKTKKSDSKKTKKDKKEKKEEELNPDEGDD